MNFKTFIIVVGLFAAACSSNSAGRNKGSVRVSVTTDIPVPKDMTAVVVEVKGEGLDPMTKRFDFTQTDRLPAQVLVEGYAGAKIEVRVVGFQGEATRVVRDAVTTIPDGKEALLAIELQWLCDALARPLGEAPISCAVGLTCIEGACRSPVTDVASLPSYAPNLVFGGGNDVAQARCFDTSACFGPLRAELTEEGTGCFVTAPPTAAGVNVALVLPAGSDGVCDADRCLIVLNGFFSGGGWTAMGDGRIALPATVCQARAAGTVLGVVVSSMCATKTVSIPICSAGTAGSPLDPNMSPLPDASASIDALPGDAAVPEDPKPPVCSMSVACGAADGCCPENGCNRLADPDCASACGNRVTEPGELCDESCPSSCPDVGCMLRRLDSPGTCQAACVDNGMKTTCANGDGCCPSGCTTATDSDCACVPAPEVCNGLDDDCDKQTDEGVTLLFYRDQDKDGFGNPELPMASCSMPAGYVNNMNDCNDGLASVNPSAAETCNGVDDNCNKSADEGVKSTFFKDGDGDGFGVQSMSMMACMAPGGYVKQVQDCDDGKASINPSAPEACDFIDNNCNTVKDENCARAKVISLNDNMAAITAKHRWCDPSAWFSDTCFSGSNRYCVSADPFFIGGYGATSFAGDGSYTITCLSSNNAVSQVTTYPTLSAFNAGCDANTKAFTLECSSAFNQYCQSLGYAAGVGPLEHNVRYYGACLRSATPVTARVNELAAYATGCNAIAKAFSGECMRAYYQYCRDSGYVSAFGATSAVAGQGISFYCVPQ